MFIRKRRYPLDEMARRGKELYESKIRPLVEAGNIGRMLAIDIESGDFAVADLGIDACQTLIDKNPDSQIWGMRIGHTASEKIGGGDTREKK